jgi:hypothetical protein
MRLQPIIVQRLCRPVVARVAGGLQVQVGVMAQALYLHGLGLLETLRGRNAGRVLQGIRALAQCVACGLLGRGIGEVGRSSACSDSARIPARGTIASITATAAVVRILRACIGVSLPGPGLSPSSRCPRRACAGQASFRSTRPHA